MNCPKHGVKVRKAKLDTYWCDECDHAWLIHKLSSYKTLEEASHIPTRNEIYDSFMKRFKKITDKYYKTGAKRWISARLIYSSVAEAERELHLALGSLNRYFNREPWDEVMGYQKH